MGCARPDSDVDLAATLGGSGETIRANYLALWPKWGTELLDKFGLTTHVNLYNDPDGDTVKRYCDCFSILLFSRSLAPSGSASAFGTQTGCSILPSGLRRGGVKRSATL
jgi:hypothetical protein